jgi:hypothetical protein
MSFPVIRLDLLSATSSLAPGLPGTSAQSGFAVDSSLRQPAPTAPPAGVSGIAAGVSAAASSTLLLVLASVLVLWLAGPSLRLRPRIAAWRPMPFVSLLERPG